MVRSSFNRCSVGKCLKVEGCLLQAIFCDFTLHIQKAVKKCVTKTLLGISRSSWLAKNDQNRLPQNVHFDRLQPLFSQLEPYPAL